MRLVRPPQPFNPCFGLWFSTLVLLQAQVAHAGDDEPMDDGEKKRHAAVSLIGNLVNGNPPPRLVENSLPLFPDDFDWEKYHMAASAFVRLAKLESPEAWDVMIEHLDDARYAVTMASGGEEEGSRNRTVGGVCHFIAFHQLVEVARYRLQDLRVSRPANLRLGDDFELAKWRRERAGKSLWELQVEICEMALRQADNTQVELGRRRETAAQVKQRVRQAIESDIAQLKETKRPIFRKLDWDSLILYDEKRANRIKEKLEKARDSTERDGDCDE